MTSSGNADRSERRYLPLALKLFFSFVILIVLVWGGTRFAETYGLNIWLVPGLSLGLALLLTYWIILPLQRRLDALGFAIKSYQSGDYGVRLGNGSNSEVTDLFGLFNQMAEQAHEKDRVSFQKEQLLETLVAQTPMAILLFGAHDRLLLSNGEARDLFQLKGSSFPHKFEEVLAGADSAFAEALAETRDMLVSVTQNMEPETYHVSQRSFFLHTVPHRLIMIKRLTMNIRRQEVKVWKDVIRLINHELNNSLAPLRSLLHSARVILKQPAQVAKLERVLTTMEEVTEGLHRFLEGYSTFARLPLPQKERVDLGEFVAQLGDLIAFEVELHLKQGFCYFDPAQIRQVLINLLKNAREASSDSQEIRLVVSETSEGLLIQVKDRGHGMKDEAFEKALLPFFSTKSTGTGLGLALCREIIESHGGTLRLQRRSQGGLTVACLLPTTPDPSS